MKTRLAAVPALSIATLALPAGAQELPPLHPSRDVAVIYRLEAGTAGTGEPQTRVIRMFWADGGTRLRLEIEGQPGIGLVDFRARRMEIMLSQAHAVLTAPFNSETIPGFFIPPDATVRRDGIDTVAGQRCDVWSIGGPRGSGQACITGDGLLLRAGSARPEKGQGQMVATSVSYGAQPDSLFAVPPDFRRIDPAKPRQ